MASPFLESLRADMRLRGYSLKTEKSYLEWIRQYIYFIGKRHPSEAGPAEVKAFLTHLAETRNVAMNTQKVALNREVGLSLAQLSGSRAEGRRCLRTVARHCRLPLEL